MSTVLIAVGGGGAALASAAKHSACLAAVPGTEECRRFDEFEAYLATVPQVDCPVTHHFTPGLYGREIFMPKGTIVTSSIHLTEHQFVVLKGRFKTWDEEHGSRILEAGFIGTTKAGTRRVLEIYEDTVFMTFHATTETDPEKILDTITLSHFDHLKDFHGIQNNKHSTQVFENDGRVIPCKLSASLTNPDRKFLEENKS